LTEFKLSKYLVIAIAQFLRATREHEAYLIISGDISGSCSSGATFLTTVSGILSLSYSANLFSNDFGLARRFFLVKSKK